ncbi:conserved hypothetical protein [Desulfonatronospira thiodismutans ASO3-1]|uniref:Uncharacterized protein n=1 Tax=Desulfonatronospira thiodismutans ASO3-1 TaxID=555779 RepID=D6SRA9_9BACT|nr:hypothetical protein [Desulfonatronospira thiodismutans]EFI33225.1 conserved hypothetical protein [Desulfonatronospira thiodismutans ASO3-1]
MQIFISINDILPAAALFFNLACFTGVPVLSLLGYLSGIARKKVFMFKMARQIARLGLLFIISTSLACAGLLGASYYYGPEADMWLEHHVFWESGLYICFVALVFFGFFTLCWNWLARVKWLHLLVGSVGGTACMLFAGILLWAVWRELDPLSPVYPQADSMFWPVLVQVYLLSIAAGSAAGLLYLLYRRNLDDFGRDYYRFVLGYVSRCGIFFAVVSPLTCIWLYFAGREVFMPDHLIMPGALFVIFLVLAVLLLLRIARSAHPLRNKAAIIVCPGVFLLVVAVRLVSYLEVADMAAQGEVLSTFMRDWMQALESWASGRIRMW